MNYGLILPEKIETREEGAQHILGASTVPGRVINPSGDYLQAVPDREPQSKDGVETQACTVYGTLSALETLILYKTGIKVNYSDRYVANVAKNRGILDPYGGADPHKIAELIRTITGNLREDRCPWTGDIRSTDDYYNIVGQELATLMSEGPAWYKEWTMNHAWVFTGGTPQEKRTKIQDALTKGTVCVSGYAWSEQTDVYVKPPGTTDNHWFQIISAIAEKPYIAFDSYDTYLKNLDPLFDFSLAKVYFLTPAHLFQKNLYYNQVDTEVTHLQTALISLGYVIPHAVTSTYGTETKGTVWRFQLDHGIEGNEGMNVGPRTRYEINKAINPSALFGGDILTALQALFSGV